VSASVFEQRWLGMEGIFGGFVLGRVVDAADTVDGFAPQAVSTHFVSAVRPGAVDLVTEVVHRGRATASVRIELRQDGRTRVHAIASLVPAAQEFSWRRTADPTPWGDPDTLAPYVPRHKPLAYSDHLDVRAVGTPTLEGGTAAWVRLAPGDRSPDDFGPHGVASIFLDVLPPGLFALDEPPAFVPTIDFTVHFAPRLGDVARGWHHVGNRTVWATRDYCVDESTLHDREGRLLAQIRQGRTIRWPV
jgi:acyl-CoA thioesterase